MRRRGFLQLLGGAAAALTLELTAPVVALVEAAQPNLAAEIAAMQDLFANEFNSIADKVFSSSAFLTSMTHRGAFEPEGGPFSDTPADYHVSQVPAHTIDIFNLNQEGNPKDRLALLGELVVV